MKHTANMPMKNTDDFLDFTLPSVIDACDLTLKTLARIPEGATREELKKEIFAGWDGVQIEAIWAMVIRQLGERGYVQSITTSNIGITAEGLKFLLSAPPKYRDRPFHYEALEPNIKRNNERATRRIARAAIVISILSFITAALAFFLKGEPPTFLSNGKLQKDVAVRDTGQLKK